MSSVETVAVRTMRRLSVLWNDHAERIANEEARTLQGALALMRKHGVRHPREAINAEAKARAIADLEKEIA